MADILAGTAGHKTFAPLSQAQTVALCQHLSDQIRELRDELTEVRADYGTTKDNLAVVRIGLADTASTITGLRDAQAETNAVLEASRRDAQRTDETMRKLRCDLSSAGEQLAAMREAQRLATAGLRKVEQDAARANATADTLQQDIDKRVGGNFEKLQDRVASLDLKMQQLEEHDTLNRKRSIEHGERIRSLAAASQEIRDDIAKTNTFVHVLEKRLLDKSTCLRDASQKLDDSTTMLSRLHSDHETTKAGLLHAQRELRETASRVGEIHDSLEQNSKKVEGLHSLDATCADLSSTRHTLDQSRTLLMTLKDGQDLAASNLQGLAAGLDETRHATHLVKASLAETRGLTLPNLQMGGPAQLELSPRSPKSAGSSSSSGTIFFPHPPASPQSARVGRTPSKSASHIRKLTVMREEACAIQGGA